MLRGRAGSLQSLRFAQGRLKTAFSRPGLAAFFIFIAECRLTRICVVICGKTAYIMGPRVARVRATGAISAEEVGNVHHGRAENAAIGGHATDEGRGSRSG